MNLHDAQRPMRSAESLGSSFFTTPEYRDIPCSTVQ
jgi:hypothetical protein